MVIGLDEDAKPRSDGATPVKVKRCKACLDQHNERPAFGVVCRGCKDRPLYCDLCKASWCTTCGESHDETARAMTEEPPFLPEGVRPVVRPKPPRVPALAHLAGLMAAAAAPRYDLPPPIDRAALIPKRRREKRQRTPEEQAERRERKRKNKRRRARRRR